MFVATIFTSDDVTDNGEYSMRGRGDRPRGTVHAVDYAGPALGNLLDAPMLALWNAPPILAMREQARRTHCAVRYSSYSSVPLSESLPYARYSSRIARTR